MRPPNVERLRSGFYSPLRNRAIFGCLWLLAEKDGAHAIGIVSTRISQETIESRSRRSPAHHIRERPKPESIYTKSRVKIAKLVRHHPHRLRFARVRNIFFWEGPMKAFTLFKKVVPLAIVAIAPNAPAGLAYTQCQSADSRFALEYNEIDFQPGKEYAFFDFAKINGIVYYGGSGSMMGRGTVTTSTIDMKLTWTATGQKVDHNMGLLKGKLVGGQWQLEFIPWNARTGKYEKTNPVELSDCSPKEF